MYQNYGCFDKSKMLTLRDLQPNVNTPRSLMWAHVFTTSVLFYDIGSKEIICLFWSMHSPTS